MQTNIIITGKPKSGKSTLLRKLIATIPNKIGFVTNEILGSNGRVGFEVETSLGTKTILAHVDFKTLYAVAKYFVNIQNLESIIPEISVFQDNNFLYIDEIGQMQLLSEKFKALTLNYLDAPNTCVATLSGVFEDDFIKTIKNREDIILIELTAENRDEQEKFITQLIKKIERAKKYSADPQRFSQSNDTIELNSEHGLRTLRQTDGKWGCNCNFFRDHKICSHTIAVQDFIKNK